MQHSRLCSLFVVVMLDRGVDKALRTCSRARGRIATVPLHMVGLMVIAVISRARSRAMVAIMVIEVCVGMLAVISRSFREGAREQWCVSVSVML